MRFLIAAVTYFHDDEPTVTCPDDWTPSGQGKFDGRWGRGRLLSIQLDARRACLAGHGG